MSPGAASQAARISLYPASSDRAGCIPRATANPGGNVPPSIFAASSRTRSVCPAATAARTPARAGSGSAASSTARSPGRFGSRKNHSFRPGHQRPDTRDDPHPARHRPRVPLPDRQPVPGERLVEPPPDARVSAGQLHPLAEHRPPPLGDVVQFADRVPSRFNASYRRAQVRSDGLVEPGRRLGQGGVRLRRPVRRQGRLRLVQGRPAPSSARAWATARSWTRCRADHTATPPAPPVPRPPPRPTAAASAARPPATSAAARSSSACRARSSAAARRPATAAATSPASAGRSAGSGARHRLHRATSSGSAPQPSSRAKASSSLARGRPAAGSPRPSRRRTAAGRSG